MARTLSIKDAAEQLDKLPALLAHEGAAPVVAVTRRGMPVLAVLPWDLYLGLLQTLANLPEEFASTQLDGIHALLADADAMSPADPSAGASSATIQRRPPHRRRPGR
ncbi:MAG TPA: hypothetical protein VH591_10005 [Ktedonobacterales bacterium]|jgi:hypothetical protein